MTARRNINDQKQYNQNRRSESVERERSSQNFGKTTINKIDKKNLSESDYVDYEEVQDDEPLN